MAVAEIVTFMVKRGISRKKLQKAENQNYLTNKSEAAAHVRRVQELKQPGGEAAKKIKILFDKVKAVHRGNRSSRPLSTPRSKYQRFM